MFVVFEYLEWAHVTYITENKKTVFLVKNFFKELFHSPIHFCPSVFLLNIHQSGGKWSNPFHKVASHLLQQNSCDDSGHH